MMLKPVRDKKERRPRRPRKRRPLKTIAMLPTTLTLGNLVAGFAAVYFCGRELQDLGAGQIATDVFTMNRGWLESLAPSFLSIACWMVFLGMICDTMDGRVARKTGQASAFGSELDSLADVVTCGVAPALMVLTLIHRELAQWGQPPLGFYRFAQASAMIGVIYVCCTALRLARFNVETSVDEASHRGFRGLPSPGAAAAAISVIYLHEHLEWMKGYVGLADVLTTALPIMTLALALLMVSRVPYAHLASSFFRRRPFWHLIPVLLGFGVILLYTELAFFTVSWTFVLSGPIRLLRHGQDETEDNGDDSEMEDDRKDHDQTPDYKRKAT